MPGYDIYGKAEKALKESEEKLRISSQRWQITFDAITRSSGVSVEPCNNALGDQVYFFRT